MEKILSWALIILIMGMFASVIYQFDVNIPSYDDYAATLIFLKNHYYNNSDVPGKIQALFAPHNEHRIVLSRASAALSYVVSGKINFQGLVWYQNMYLLGVFLLIAGIIRQQRLPFYPALLVVSFFLFNLAFWQVTLYYWGGIQYFAVYFFIIASLCCLQASSRAYFLLGMLMAGLAMLSFGNGILVLPLGFFLLAAQYKTRRLLVWTVFAVAGVAFFFISFHTSYGEKPPFNLQWMGRLLFTFLGSFLYVSPANRFWYYANIILCSVAGVGVLYTWLRLLYNGYAFRNPFLYCLYSLPILTGIIIALARFDAKAAGGIAPRYMFFSACIPIFLFLIYQDTKRNKKVVALPFLVLAVAVWGMSFINNLREIKRNTDEITVTFRRWQLDNTTPLVHYNHDPKYSEALVWAMHSGIYTPPAETRINVNYSTSSP